MMAKAHWREGTPERRKGEGNLAPSFADLGYGLRDTASVIGMNGVRRRDCKEEDSLKEFGWESF